MHTEEKDNELWLVSITLLFYCLHNSTQMVLECIFQDQVDNIIFSHLKQSTLLDFL